MQKLLAGLAAATAIVLASFLLSPVPASADTTYYVAPQYKHQVKPIYPDSARAAHETGTVFVKVLVMANGTVPHNGITLFKSSGHPDLDSAVLAAVKQTTFKPATRNGTPVTAFKDVVITFTLHGAAEAGGNTSDLARKLQANPRDMDTRLKLATGYLNKQEFASAESVLKDGASLEPNNAKLWARLGIAYYGDAVQTKNNERYALASQAFDKAFSVDPHVDTSGVATVAYSTYALNLIVSHQYQTALTYAQKAAQLDPKRADAQIETGDAYAGLQNFQAALPAYKQAQQLDNKKSAAVTSLILTRVGNTYLQLGNESEGLATIQQAESIDAHNPRPYQAVADYYLRKGNPDKALPPLKQLEQINPNDANTKARIAEVYIQQKNWAQAKTELSAALTIQPNNPSALFGMAELAANQGDTAGADSYLQRAIAADKSSAAIFNDLIARIYLQQNNKTADAQKYALAATQADPNYPGAWYDLGIAYANGGNRNDATNALKKAYTLFKASGNTDGASAAAKAYKQVSGQDLAG